jgi:Type II CAAX prenyl endopeptidase Rce1-like
MRWSVILDFYNAYFVVALYPLLAYLFGDPAAFRWGLEHGSEAMPPAVELRTQRNGRVYWILRYLVLSAYLLYGLRAIPIHTVTPIRSAIVGIILGLALVQVRLLAIRLWPDLSFANAAHPALLGPIGVWAAIIVLGGFSEELWRAFCLVSLHRDGSNMEAAILGTSVVFALSELAGRPSRISSQREEVAFTVLVGVCLAELFLTFHSVTMIICANVAYNGLSFYRLRRDEGLAIRKLPPENP